MLQYDKMKFVLTCIALLAMMTEGKSETCTELGYFCVSDCYLTTNGRRMCYLVNDPSFFRMQPQGLVWDYCVEHCNDQAGKEVTVMGNNCIFPMSYKGVHYNTCIKDNSFFKGTPFCVTSRPNFPKQIFYEVCASSTSTTLNMTDDFQNETVVSTRDGENVLNETGSLSSSVSNFVAEMYNGNTTTHQSPETISIENFDRTDEKKEQLEPWAWALIGAIFGVISVILLLACCLFCRNRQKEPKYGSETVSSTHPENEGDGNYDFTYISGKDYCSQSLQVPRKQRNVNLYEEIQDFPQLKVNILYRDTGSLPLPRHFNQ